MATIKFGTYEYELRRGIRVGGTVFDCLFAPNGVSFEDMKKILSTKANTTKIEVFDGDEVTVYSDFTVLKKLEYGYSDSTTECHAMLQTANLQEQVDDCSNEIDITSKSVDDVITEVIPSILDELKAYVDEKIS